MAGAKFEYDENGSTFFYFLLSFEAFIIFPATCYYFFSVFSKRSSRSPNENERVCHCEHCAIKNSRLRAKQPYQKYRQNLINIVLFAAWILLFLTYYKVRTLTLKETVTFDPFEILQITPDAPMSEIKRAYRKLSLLYHPDKSSGDEKRFMMLTKAYSALTNEEARKNWEKYGNPDGPGAVSFGMALPSWIVDEKNSLMVLGVYALLIMILAIGIWCYRSMNMHTESVLYATCKMYYKLICVTPHMIFKRVIMIIAVSLEFEHSHNKEIIERESDNIELPALIKTLASHGLNEKNRERPFCFGYSIKARALIYAHLSRLKLSNALEHDKHVVIKKCPLLIAEFVSCTAKCTLVALAGRMPRAPTLETLENAMKLSQCLVQALWNNQSSLMQLPHITEDMLKHFTTRKRNIRSVWHLASMHDEDRRSVLRCLTDDQYSDILSVISNMPAITAEVRAEVMGDDDHYTITTGAFVTVTVTLIRQSMSIGEKSKEVKEKSHTPGCVNLYSGKEEKPAAANGVEIVKKPPVWMKPKKKKFKRLAKKRANGVSLNSAANEKTKESDSENESDESSDEKEKINDGEDEEADWDTFKKKIYETKKSKSSQLVHCPFFPSTKRECWWVYIADKRRQALKTAPFLVTTLVDQEDVELKFSAPLKPGLYSYAVIVRSDSYIDVDVVKVLKLNVEEGKDEGILLSNRDEGEEDDDDEGSAFEDPDLLDDDSNKNE